MSPPCKRPKRSKIPTISLSAPRVLNSNSPILSQDIHGFVTTALSPALWDQYSEAQKRDLIDLFPTACRIYHADAEGKLKCPVSTEFLESDPYLKAGTARFKRDVKDGCWEARWQNQAVRAMEERKEGKFDAYLQEHAEELFGEEARDPAGEDGGEGHSGSDWEQKRGRKKAADEEYIVERLLRIGPRGTHIKVKWHGYDEPTWEPRARLLEDVPDMVAAVETRQDGDPDAPPVQDEENDTAQGNIVVLSSLVDVAQRSYTEMRDVATG